MEKSRLLKQPISLCRKVVSSRSISVFLCATLIGTSFTGSIQKASAETTTGPLVTGKTYDAYTPLKDVYKDYFTMGIFGSGDTNALIYNFDSFAPGNEMKPENTQREKGKFTYSSCDNLFNGLQNLNPNIQFYGHTLAWHSQTPSWMWDGAPASYGQPGTNDKATALANLNNHIDNVLGHFGGRIKGIDVVNEAVQEANPSDWKASLAPQGCWYSALGWEWVEDAFLEAAKVVDEHPDWNCKLRYNDFGLDNPKKAQTVYEMVKDINKRYEGVRPNGKPLIEVIGMQAHYSSTTNTDNVESAIKLFSTLPGVKVNITESDVGAPPIGKLTPENENNQAVEWAKLFQIYKKYAAGSANTTGNPKVIDQIDIGGVRDAGSYGWRAGEFALLFDTNGLAKQALIAVLQPEEFLKTHEYIDPNHGEAPKHIDGVYVYSTANGDDYSGANIILGNNAKQWPWSTAGDDGKVAFTPEKDATYRLSINYTSQGTSAIRVRWIKDNTNGGYTSTDGTNSNKYLYSAGQVANTIPAYFNSGMVAAGSYTLTDEFKMDGSQPADGLIGNIAIRGGGGGNAFSINWIKVEKVGTQGASDKLLVNWPEGIKEPKPDGLHIYDAGSGDDFSGANIILGNDASRWPWSTAGEDGKVAFTPENDASYRLSFNYTSNGTSAIRVRWLKDDTNGGYTSSDSSLVNNYTYSPDQVATTIPAYFNKGMSNGGNYTLTTEIKLDGSQPANGLIGNIAIRGGGGGNAFTINWIKVEKIKADGTTDRSLVNWSNGLKDPDSDLVDVAVQAIEKGTYKIPYSEKTNQDTKNAWVQSAVNALIPARSGATAAVTYNNGYVVAVSKGVVTKPASITVTEQKSPVNKLKSLTLSTGTLEPVFDGDTTDYSLKVQNSITTFKVTPVLEDLTAAMTVNGENVTSGDQSQEIKLNVGENPITIVVTAEDGTARTYTVKVNRLSGDTNSNNNQGNQNTTGGSALPQTGALVDMRVMIAIGIAMLLGGAILFSKKRENA